MKESYEKLKTERNSLENKYWGAIDEKKALEERTAENLRNIQSALVAKQQELEEMQSKFLNTFDHDLERMRIKSKLELQYAKDIESKQIQIDNLQVERDDLAKEHEIAKSRLENLETEQEKTLNLLNESHKVKKTQSNLKRSR